jgi:hypothetical protein
MLTMCNIHWLARPHLMGWVFLLLAVLAAEHAPAHLEIKFLAAIFLAGILWANIHGSFFLGAGIFFLYGAEKWWRQDPGWTTLAVAGMLALISSLVNPYGWHVHEHIIDYLRDEELLARVGEFQSFNFHLEGAMPLVIGMAVVGAGISLNAVQGNYARAILCLVLFAGALRSARGIPLVALIGMPLALGAISRELEKLPRLAAFITYNNNLRKMDSGLRGWALMPVLMLALFVVGQLPIFAKTPGFAEELFPVKVSAAIEKLPADARLFSTDKFGGYLIYRFAGQRKVFFDGRSDF